MMFGMRHFGAAPLISVKGLHFLSTSAYAIVGEDGSYRFGPVSDLRFAVRGKEDRPYADVIRGDVSKVGDLARLPIRDENDVFVRDYGSTTRDIRWQLYAGPPARGGLAGQLTAFAAAGVTVVADNYFCEFRRHEGGIWSYGAAPNPIPLKAYEFAVQFPTNPSRLSINQGRAYWHGAACEDGAWGIGITDGEVLTLGRWMASDAEEDEEPVVIDLPEIDLPDVADAEVFDARWTGAAILAVDGDTLIVQAMHRRRIRTPSAMRADGFDPARDGYVYGDESWVYRITIRADSIVDAYDIGRVQVRVAQVATPPEPDEFGNTPIVGPYGEIEFVGSGTYLTAAMRTRTALREFSTAWDKDPDATAITMAIVLIDDDQTKEDARPFVAVASPYGGALATIREDGSIIQAYGGGGWVYYSGQSAIQHDFKVPPVVYARLNF